MTLRTFPTPLGEMVAGACPGGLCLLEFKTRRALPGEVAELERLLPTMRPGPAPIDPAPDVADHLDAAERQLAEYFAGTRRVFDIPLVTPGTPFERAVWAGLLAIPFGATRSYGSLAAGLGKPGGMRAVGRANGRNRISIVVPCHRVIETGGDLGGYGGGLERKRWLLDHERGLAPERSTPLFGLASA
ncbi:MAG TPA: methylated-DNA--[protein]-cysteine S-methyltransferase [Phycisphaerales bacterium]|nr:methylated-DNA--[protein]-cysteine S-methyltransferase [Phycisphaerales bacterium]